MCDPFAAYTDLAVCGGPVRLYRAGDSGPPLLLLHGGMFDTAAGVWRDVAPRLATDHRVYLIDLPRHGGSRPWRGVLDAAFFTRFLDELLDTLELPRVSIIGLSLGAGIAIGYALQHPRRINGLVATAPGGLGDRRKAQFLTWLIIRMPWVLKLTSRYLARRPRTVRRSMIDNLSAGTATRDVDAIIDLVTREAKAKAAYGEPALDDWMVRAYGPLAMRVNYLPDLHRLTVPTLWVRGDRDQLVGPTEMTAAASAVPGSRLITIPDAGHIVTYDQPDEFIRLTREFLATLPGDAC